MYWSIFDDSSSQLVNEWKPDHRAWAYDGENERVAIPDGPVMVHYDWDGIKGSTICFVRDGKWDVEHALDRIDEMVEGCGYWGKFLEAFELVDNNLHVVIGS